MTDKIAPAFPYLPPAYTVDENGSFKPVSSGLTKREYAAIAAMQGLLANSRMDECFGDNSIAETAIFYADELLAELEKDNG